MKSNYVSNTKWKECVALFPILQRSVTSPRGWGVLICARPTVCCPGPVLGLRRWSGLLCAGAPGSGSAAPSGQLKCELSSASSPFKSLLSSETLSKMVHEASVTAGSSPSAHACGVASMLGQKAQSGTCCTSFH